MLKSLEIYGFKSFADRTRFEFSPGLTGIVGPNGSGKSNVVDALKWILGDQSPKSLRGQEMTDVIFNGSASRKPCSYAEAFLTLDNTQRVLKIEADEITIGRRLYRGGDAEYLINKAPARLKDVRDLLLGTGAGNAAYCIIEQGRVDQILQANPTNRRVIFEEAAGISRFKSRRVEAQRKLERVAQNLQRLSDIVDEVEAQLNATRGHAAKAVKFRELSEELRRWWLGLAADDYRAIAAELAGVQDRAARCEARLEALAALQQEFDAGEARFDRDLSELELHLKEAERKFAQLREAMATQEASLKFQMARQQELEAERRRLQEQQRLLQRRTEEAEQQITRQREHWLQAQQEEAALKQRLTAQDEQWRQSVAAAEQQRERVEACRGKQRELTRSVTAAEQAVAAWEAQADALEQSRERLLGRRQEVLQQQADIEHTCQRRRCEYESLRQAHEAAQEQVRAHSTVLQELSAVQQALQQRLSSLREARSAAAARRTVLEDLELRQEGLGIGVRELLHRARHAHEPPWNTIVGSVAELLEVDLEHAGLVEVALGPRAQWIVLREFQSLLDYLARGAVTLTGRVGFLAVPERTISQPSPTLREAGRLIHLQRPAQSTLDLRARPGVLRRADELVASERGVTGLAAAVLGDTWVVSDLAVAAELATEVGDGVRFVTLQGELVDGQGAIHLGLIRSETSLLSRKSELRRIKNELARAERELGLAEEEGQQVAADVRATEIALQTATRRLEDLEQQLAQALAESRMADQEAERCRHEAEILEGQLQAAETDLQRAQREAQSAHARWETLRGDLQTVDGELSAAEAAWQAAVQAAQALDHIKTREQVDLVKQSERVRAELAALERWQSEHRQRQAQQAEGQQRIEAVREQQTRLRLQILNARAALADLYHAADRQELEVRRWQQLKEQLRRERSEFVERELQVRRERRELQDQRHAEDIRRQELQHQLATLAERIHEEYQFTLEEIAAQGHSAWSLFLEQRRQLASEDTDEAAKPAGSATLAAHSPTAPWEDQLPATAAAAEFSPPSLGPAGTVPQFAEVRPEIEAHVARLRRKLKLLGHVNTDSLRDLEQLEQRFSLLSGQLQDLVEAKSALEEIIRRFNQESRRLFAETFAKIRGNFQHLFRKVFGGGEGDILLEDPNDMLECGIEIVARPPGKELRSLSLLSGGEKSMTAIALVMAIFQAKPSPFCILDEVDAALDEANIDRFAAVLKEFRATTQFIMITHHKRSMMNADVLYGVTMEESGVSKRMSVRFEDIGENGEFRRAA
jgi:chromosome segregation protein